MELKQFSSRQDFLNTYNFPKEKQDEIDSCWFMSPIEAQLSRFNNGLGKVTYFKTKKRDLETNPYVDELEKLENQKPVVYEMITEYVLVDEYVHPANCTCGCTEDKQAHLLKLDGFDNCYLGIGETYGEPPALIYDYAQIIEHLQQQDGISQEEAEEYFEFNILGSYIGEKMPIFLNRIPLEDLDVS
jgi:hypothetical protein